MYSSWELSLHATGLKVVIFSNLFLTCWAKSLKSSHLKTFKIIFHHFFKNLSENSQIAIFNSTDAYWSTSNLQVVFGAISEVITSNWSSQIISNTCLDNLS